MSVKKSLSKSVYLIFFTVKYLSLQIKSESFLEDINNILNSGDVPNLYTSEEEERIFTGMKPVVQNLNQQPTKTNLMAAYIKRVRSNIHIVLCMRLVRAGLKFSSMSGMFLTAPSYPFLFPC